MEEERAAGRTFVIATHNLTFVEERCDRAALIVGGRVKALGAGKDVVRCCRDLLASEGKGSSG